MRLIIDFWVFLATVTGLIPSHIIRLFLYRTLFRVKIGKDSSIHWLCRFNQPSGIFIGNNTIIGNDAFLDGRVKREGKGNKPTILTYLHDFLTPSVRPVTIGNNVSIAGEVRLFSMQHDIDDPDFKEISSPVTIEDYAVIGTRVTILPGVTVGKGAVVASGAVVTHTVEPYTVVGGVPAVFIRNRPKNLRYTLKFARLFQ